MVRCASELQIRQPLFKLSAFEQPVEVIPMWQLILDGAGTPDRGSYFVAIVSAGIDAIGIVLLVWTILIGTKATNAATAAAEASKKATIIAEKGLVAGQRAYVSHEPSIDYISDRNQTKFESISIFHALFNSGATPAIDCLIGSAVVVDKAPDSADSHAGDNLRKLFAYVGPFDLGSNRNTRRAPIAVPVSTLNDAIKDNHRVYLLTHVQYKDVFEETNQHNDYYIWQFDVIDHPSMWKTDFSDKMRRISVKRARGKWLEVLQDISHDALSKKINDDAEH